MVLNDLTKNKDVKVFEIKIVHDANVDDVICFATHCKTGNRIHAKIKEKDLNKAINIGFYQ